ncbi:hypothetical protein ARTSIC4J27_4321 [Pseudarthrobacter siccitolerans]|uniref:Uncharacterized protein n=1 Tax=Pseudarthrobacter siccitolerans TaxID=861266 RepID=A0A024H810_9MICC|nr:hypothetical protein ARTSIC4J27_4321 [Pseudarthrobacter siccitolerans]
MHGGISFCAGCLEGGGGGGWGPIGEGPGLSLRRLGADGD